MATTDFEREVLSSLKEFMEVQARQGVHIENINSHLARLNGSVARQEAKIQDHQDEIVRIKAEHEAHDKEQNRWEKRINPFVMVVVGILATLILQHGKSLVVAIGKP